MQNNKMATEAEAGTEQKIAELKGKPLKTFELTYDSFGEGLEPIYFWVLDFMKDLGYEVEKTSDFFAASEGSAWYGEMGLRRSNLEKQAREIMAVINAIVKSIINILWELKEFEIRFDSYKKFLEGKDEQEKRTGDLALKAIWLTEVDMKKQRGSINFLSQELNFVTLREAFMAAKTWGSEDDARASIKSIDVNQRVKNILEPRVFEYMRWAKDSYKELKKRYDVERAYLKSQVNALKYNTKMVKPYLIATNKLIPKESISDQDELVTLFNTIRIDLAVLGTKKVKAPEKGKEVQLFDEGKRPYQCLEVYFKFRSIPMSAQTQDGGRQYVQTGKTIITFNAYLASKENLDKIKRLQEQEVFDLIEGMTSASLDAMREDLDRFLLKEEIEEKLKKLKDKKEKAEYVRGVLKDVKNEELKKEIEAMLGESLEGKKKLEIPILSNIMDFAEPIKKAISALNSLSQLKSKKGEDWTIRRLEAVGRSKAIKDCTTMYETYKKTHRMLAL